MPACARALLATLARPWTENGEKLVQLVHRENALKPEALTAQHTNLEKPITSSLSNPRHPERKANEAWFRQAWLPPTSAVLDWFVRFWAFVWFRDRGSLLRDQDSGSRNRVEVFGMRVLKGWQGKC